MHTLQAKWFFFFTLLKVNYRLIYILAAPAWRQRSGEARRALVQAPSASSSPLHISHRSTTSSSLSELQVKEFNTFHPCFLSAYFLSFYLDISGSKAHRGDQSPLEQLGTSAHSHRHHCTGTASFLHVIYQDAWTTSASKSLGSAIWPAAKAPALVHW